MRKLIAALIVSAIPAFCDRIDLGLLAYDPGANGAGNQIEIDNFTATMFCGIEGTSNNCTSSLDLTELQISVLFENGSSLVLVPGSGELNACNPGIRDCSLSFTALSVTNASINDPIQALTLTGKLAPSTSGVSSLSLSNGSSVQIASPISTTLFASSGNRFNSSEFVVITADTNVPEPRTLQYFLVALTALALQFRHRKQTT